MLEHRISDALLLFNEVLNKGFEGSHFITGLASHFRDLLVSKDPVTLPLLEVGAGIRQRYGEQAKKCPLPFLYRAMKLCNDCDLNYRASRNKRLLVELTLIQLGQLNPEGEEVPGGRSPQPVIKPITTPQQPATQPQPVAAPQPAQPQPTQTRPAAQPSQAAQTTAARVASVLSAHKAEEKKIPVMNKGGLGISIKHTPAEEKAYEPAPATVPTQVAEAQPQEDYIFNERDVNYYWQEYAGRLPHEQVALAKRMQNMHLTLLNATTFEAVVDNPIVAKDFTALVPAIQDYLRTRLKNSKVTMSVRVSAAEEKVRAYSRTEQFQMMMEKNKALKELQDEFGLEFA